MRQLFNIRTCNSSNEDEKEAVFVEQLQDIKQENWTMMQTSTS